MFAKRTGDKPGVVGRRFAIVWKEAAGAWSLHRGKQGEDTERVRHPHFMSLNQVPQKCPWTFQAHESLHFLCCRYLVVVVVVWFVGGLIPFELGFCHLEPKESWEEWGQ